MSLQAVAFNRKLKILTVINPVSNRSPVIYPAYSINGRDVSKILAYTGLRDPVFRCGVSHPSGSKGQP